MYRANNVAYVWNKSPVQSLEDLKTKEAIIGTSGPGSGRTTSRSWRARCSA